MPTFVDWKVWCMMKASGVALGIRPQPREGFRPQPSEDCQEHTGYSEIAPLFTDADEYYRGTSELHVHYAIGNRDRCIVLECCRLDDFCGHDLPAAFENKLGSYISEAMDDDGQPLVPVFIGEPVEEIEGMLLRRIPTRVKRHQFLEDCDRLCRAYVTHQAVPAFAVFRPLLVLRCDMRDIPDWLVQDGTEHVAALPGWDQGAHQVVEGRAQVVKDVACDKADFGIRGFREFQIGETLAALVLDGVRNRVWVFIREVSESPCHVDDVMFGPVGLTSI